MTKKAVSPFASEIDLRRWCIEQAMNWPVFYGVSGVSDAQRAAHEDADVIGRAKEIRKWVTTK